MIEIQFNSTILENSSDSNNFVLSLNKNFGEMILNENKFELYAEAPIKIFVDDETIEVISFTPIIILKNIYTLESSIADFQILLKADNLMEAIKEAKENADSHTEFIGDSYSLLSVFNEEFASLLAGSQETCATSSGNNKGKELSENLIDNEVNISSSTEILFNNLEKEQILKEIDICLDEKELNYEKLKELSNMLKQYN